MPETPVDHVRCGQTQQQHDKIQHPEEPVLPRAPPQIREGPPTTSGNQRCSVMEDVKQKQQRPSVLCHLSHTAFRQKHETSTAVSVCKEEADSDHLSRSSSPHVSSSLGHGHHLFSLRRDAAKQRFTETRPQHSHPEVTRALFVSGFCRWPDCDAVTEDFQSFLKHLSSEHGHSERSIAQWKVQQDIVQCMESQLNLEKQKLVAMQLHLHLSENKYNEMSVSSDWPYSLPLYLPQPLVVDGDVVQQWAIKHLEELNQHGNRAAAAAHFLPDLVPSLDFYKYNNIRPPYTYAYLIRWSILESPDKQRTLNEIYNWFTTMFYYFRHNPATWKNAVRHNLSLHKCFVRVEGGKGAVWTVDETEYQRRKGQKYHRDCPVKWFKPFTHYCPEDP